jgi:hypothetical protein
MVERNSRRRRQYCSFRIFYSNVSVNEARISFFRTIFCCFFFFVFFHVLMILFTRR